MWTSIAQHPDCLPHAALGAYRQHRGTWSSHWRQGESELKVMGYGPHPTSAQVATWNIIRTKLDEVLATALNSLPLPPKRRGLARLFGKPVVIDNRHPLLELGDDGLYQIQFGSNLVIEGDSTSPLIQMQGMRVVSAEWSC